VLRPSAIPWSRPRHERLLLGLVAAVTLSSIFVSGTQDISRLCLTRAILHGHLTIQPCAGNTIDQASFGGHNYTDKAPGVSFIALPAAVIVRLRDPSRWVSEGDFRLWFVRLFVTGIAFVAATFVVGRISEGMVPGYGGAALVTYALGTLVSPLAISIFDHVLAGSLAFGAFALAWSRRFMLAGLLAGTAAISNYPTALIAIVLGLYVLLSGIRPLLRFAIGAAPPLALLGAYDWAAFDSPFHLSYRYVANVYTSDQASGFFGIHFPTAHGLHRVFVGDRGMLITFPVAVAAAAGLAFLGRRYQAEAIVCGVAFGLLLFANCGYFNPYGGISPGPRFLVPGLPFVALGLAPAFRRWWWPTIALAAASIAAMTTLLVTWANLENMHYRGTVWGELGRLASERGSSRLVHMLTKNVIVTGPITRLWAAGLLGLLAAVAFVVSLRDARAAR
jgi:hypothetical protein